MEVSRQKVELHIDEVVLHGFPPGGTRAIAAAIEAELGRLLAVQGLPASFEGGPSFGTLDAGSFEAERDAAPGDLGTRIARSVHGGFAP
jgi:hypothetical protein